MKDILEFIEKIAKIADDANNNKRKLPFKFVLVLIKENINIVEKHINATDKATIYRNQQMLNSIILSNVDIDSADFAGVDKKEFDEYINCIKHAVSLKTLIENKSIARLNTLRKNIFDDDASDDLESLSKDELIARLREKSK